MRRNLANNVQNYYNKSLPFSLNIVAVKFATVPKLEEDIIQLSKCFYEAACDHKMSLGEAVNCPILAACVYACI